MCAWARVHVCVCAHMSLCACVYSCPSLCVCVYTVGVCLRIYVLTAAGRQDAYLHAILKKVLSVPKRRVPRVFLLTHWHFSGSSSPPSVLTRVSQSNFHSFFFSLFSIGRAALKCHACPFHPNNLISVCICQAPLALYLHVRGHCLR